MKITNLDLELVKNMAREGATDSEIAAFYDCRTSTITNRGRKSLSLGRELLKMDIRKAQINLAKEGNSAMLTFLGKEILNQTGKPSEDEDTKPEKAEGRMSTKKLTQLLNKGAK